MTSDLRKGGGFSRRTAQPGQGSDVGNWALCVEKAEGISFHQFSCGCLKDIPVPVPSATGHSPKEVTRESQLNQSPNPSPFPQPRLECEAEEGVGVEKQREWNQEITGFAGAVMTL